MFEILERVRSARASPSRAVVVTVLLLAAVVSVQAAPVPTSVDVVSVHCYAWEFINLTGEDADGLIVRLAGIRQVSEVYTGPGNPFGLPGDGSGYDAAQDVYSLVFSGGPAFSGEAALIGLCTDRPLLALGPSLKIPPFVWLLGGRALSPEPLFVGVQWAWDGRAHVQVTLHNSGQAPLVLWSAYLLEPEQTLSVDELGSDALAGQATVAELLEGGEILPAGGDRLFDVPFDPAAAPGQPFVLDALLSAEDDFGNTVHLFSQASAPLVGLYLPVILK